MGTEIREEFSLILISLDESMGSISISFNSSHDNETIFIFKFSWLHDTCSSSLGSFSINTSSIIDSESNIFNSVTMFGEMSIEFFMAGWVQACFKSKSDFSVRNNVGAVLSISGL